MIKFIKNILKLITILVIIGAGLITSLLYFTFEANPLVVRQAPIQNDDLQQIQQLISANRPDLNTFNRPKQIALSAQHLNQLLQYGSQKVLPTVNARVVLDKRLIYIALTYAVPKKRNPLDFIGDYINVRAELVQQGARDFTVRNLKLGQITVPDLLVEYFEPAIVLHIKKEFGSYVRLYQLIENIQINSEQVVVNYKIEKETLKQIKQLGNELVISDAIRQRVIAYSDEIGRVSQQLAAASGRNSFSAIELLKPMFLFARLRSEQFGQAAEENKILLLTLGAFITGRNPAQYVSTGRAERFVKLRMTLQGRRDLVQHYLVSAAIAAVADLAWADAIGLQKELNDSNGGSGFSFSDLMADKAGTMLTTSALASDNRAAEIQRRMEILTTDEQILPAVSDLPDGLTALQFKTRFKTTSSYEYQSMIRELERRLATCDVYR